MKCDLCGNNEAKYKYYEVDSEGVREMNICSECAHRKGIDFSPRTQELKVDNIVCKNCNLSFKEYKKKNRLGCTECYINFRSKIDSILLQTHNSLIHKGKKPVKNAKLLSMKKEIRELQKTLEDSVKKEKYEEAVHIRDKIEKYQEELKSIRRNK
jgi:protein arginine kinase activator